MSYVGKLGFFVLFSRFFCFHKFYGSGDVDMQQHRFSGAGDTCDRLPVFGALVVDSSVANLVHSAASQLLPSVVCSAANLVKSAAS
ncbi:unnamed protein product [Linum trigynum]|uniref:Secreted protein n=1 Tax=Linum trigynum TaxID=586398 RepID=A0AAV2FEZ6_9ROSI